MRPPLTCCCSCGCLSPDMLPGKGGTRNIHLESVGFQKMPIQIIIPRESGARGVFDTEELTSILRPRHLVYVCGLNALSCEQAAERGYAK